MWSDLSHTNTLGSCALTHFDEDGGSPSFSLVQSPTSLVQSAKKSPKINCGAIKGPLRTPRRRRRPPFPSRALIHAWKNANEQIWAGGTTGRATKERTEGAQEINLSVRKIEQSFRERRGRHCKWHPISGRQSGPGNFFCGAQCSPKAEVDL